MGIQSNGSNADLAQCRPTPDFQHGQLKPEVMLEFRCRSTSCNVGVASVDWVPRKPGNRRWECLSTYRRTWNISASDFSHRRFISDYLSYWLNISASASVGYVLLSVLVVFGLGIPENVEIVLKITYLRLAEPGTFLFPVSAADVGFLMSVSIGRGQL